MVDERPWGWRRAAGSEPELRLEQSLSSAARHGREERIHRTGAGSWWALLWVGVDSCAAVGRRASWRQVMASESPGGSRGWEEAGGEM